MITFWPGTSIPKSHSNAFDWQGHPSIFTTGRGNVFGVLSTGKTRSDTARESVEARTAATGKNPGTIHGIARKSRAKA